MDAARLAVGTLTAFPVPPPAVVDRRAAGRALLLAPVTGLALALVWTVTAWLGWRVGLPSLAIGGLVVAAELLCTRAFHHDGLADTVDALASGYDRERALTIMRRGDVGPAGAVALAVTALIEAACIGDLATSSGGLFALATAPVIARCVVPLLTGSTGSARPDGLGALVAGSPTRGWLPVVGALALALVGARTGLGFGPAIGCLGAVIVTLALRHRALQRFGGLTGDVIGAAVRLACVVTLLACAAVHTGG